ncbi:metallo-beta-lactamase [Streptomyces alboflavus]|uniref:Metallo-beta-lactamase n=1 Tax=Streptomyces alboflavus TaxID=67267 RepID=A0A1Z1W4Z7_9ACTN|nr:metallo-beta-lactamase [Streptomyces alboflavus]
MNAIEIIELRPRLHLFRFPVGQAYLWRDDEELTLVDAGPPGGGAALADAITGLGLRPRDVRRVVLTHFHGDHAGGAGEFAELTGATVYAHHLDAPMVRGEVPGPPAVLEDWEVPIFEEATKHVPAATEQHAYAPDLQEVADDDVLDFGGGARLVSARGHTAGSVGVHLPRHGVLFTGDAVASAPGHGVLLGVGNQDRDEAVASFHRLAALEADVACFGHGDPVERDASAVLRAAAEQYGNA